MSLFYRGSIASQYRSLVVSTASLPSARPVDTEEAKEHLRIVDTTADDDYIDHLIDAATTWCEDYCDRTFADKTYTVAFDDFFGTRIELPRPPVRLNATAASATVTISYVDTGGATQTLTWAQSGTQNFRLDRDHVPALIYPKYLEVWPSVRIDDKSVQITYLAGYGGAAHVPKPAVHAIKMLVGHWYANREAVGNAGQNVPMGVAALLEPLKWKQYT
ncbi:MAG: head-tail connector protein [Ilumatobacteraceae bacterium]